MRKHKFIVGWTADEVAECISYKDDEAHSIYVRLWEHEASDQWWSKLDDWMKQAVNEGARKEAALWWK